MVTTKINNTIKKIYFRADANSQIGWGHVVRCMALADMLISDTNSIFECVFLVQNPSVTLQNQIKEKFELVILKETTDFLEEAHFITQKYLQGNSIIVLDHYQIQTEYQRIIKENCNSKIVCIDDMHSWHFLADVVINHAGGLKPASYSCESYTKLCLGTDYALLRKPFLEAAKQKREINKISNVFICFGGSDIHNLTQKAVEACLKQNTFEEIHVVLGSASLFYPEVLEVSKTNDKIILYQNLSAQQMCDVMKKCQVAIAPASSIAYEASMIGIYLITGWYAENQEKFAHYLQSINAYNCGNIAKTDLGETIKLFLDNKDKKIVKIDTKSSKHKFHYIWQQ